MVNTEYVDKIEQIITTETSTESTSTTHITTSSTTTDQSTSETSAATTTTTTTTSSIGRTIPEISPSFLIFAVILTLGGLTIRKRRFRS